MKNTVAIYPGSFDPLTKGHEDLIHRASRLWDKLIIAVAVAHHKKTLFSLEERMDIVCQVLKNYENIEVHSFSGLLKDAVEEHHASVIVRGVRAVSDFDYEFQMAGMNKQLMPHIDSVFLVPGQEHHFTSGTFVREIGLLGGDVSSLVSPYVEEQLKKKRQLQGLA